jgi:deoxyribose-phosphate aldolase
MLANHIDQTALRPFLKKEEFYAFLEDAKTNKFATVCIPPYLVEEAVARLEGSGVLVCTVIGFPLGYNLLHTKISEAIAALSQGAKELDMVINISAFKSGEYEYVQEEIRQLAVLCHREGAILKVIIETAYLTDQETVKACALCAEAGADFVKTSTGFAPEGAVVERIKLMRASLPEHIKIKASGGISTYAQAMAFIEAGADRIGTSSGSKLVEHES